MNSEASSPTAVIVGLGYVGLTLGVALAQRGCRVIGLEKREDVVDLTNAGKPHFSETGLDRAMSKVVENGNFIACTALDPALEAGYYVITVGTPLIAGSTKPRIDMIEQASRQVADHMRDGASVTLRSTVKLGTARDVVRPILAESGKSFHLAMCPERTLEGAALKELAELPQIVSGETAEAADKAAALFGLLTPAVVRVSDLETAEMIKLIDNTSRDVRFAFANEVARACDAVGIDAGEVIRSGKFEYPRTDVALPGLVGGPCLEKDPHILMASLAETGTALEITRACRLVNERQPEETVNAIVARLVERGKGPFRVAIAGMAFKGRPETDDLRGSMSLKVIDALQARDEIGSIVTYDGVVAREDIDALGLDIEVADDLVSACDGAHALIIANNHPEYSDLDIDSCVDAMNDGGFIYDYWAHLVKRPPATLEGRYFVVGNNRGRF
ncbi:nucleotide sugar dehydrogenase [Aurantiacibacter aquimixticola]|uniref:Nucleotide sugar dehydrogenase n=1 Tax=Aurantiacibacter aquimixticola TaxID=1958945 RepID=A0A419RUK3_9SPHN|nr:nucleotide sugar dehydrogenase [Aurantiacibacter aquimixticola]RJY09466.1 nucleotide sugar dehydrogenase [Aurantiacibacter aquimixticola]